MKIIPELSPQVDLDNGIFERIKLFYSLLFNHTIQGEYLGKWGDLKTYSCYLFDADGTLFDTTELICQCYFNTARIAGKAELNREMVLSSIGMTLRDQMEIHFGPLTEEQFRDLREIHMDYQLSVYKKYLKLCCGVHESLKYLTEQGRRCVVVTSRMRPTLDIYLKETGIFSFFEHFITPELTLRHKPDPQPALKALELLHCKPEESLFIGDSTFDIECGHSAGTSTAFVGWSLNEPGTLRISPTYYLNDMRDLCIV